MDFAASTMCMTLLVAARMAGLVMLSPVLGEQVVPLRLRAMIAIVLSLGVGAGLAGHPDMMAAVPTGLAALVLGLAGEVLIGLAIGYAARLIFVGVELGAFHVSQQMGISLNEVFSGEGQGGDALRDFWRLLALVIFLSVGGHRLLIGELIHSFDAVPPLAAFAGTQLLAMVTGLLTTSFALALKVSACVLLAMLLAGVLLALVQRTLPQLNILSVGLPVRFALGLGGVAVMLSLGVLPRLISWSSSSLCSQIRSCMEGGR